MVSGIIRGDVPSCAVCGLSGVLRPSFEPRFEGERMFVVGVSLDTEDQRRIWRMFIRHAVDRRWIGHCVCVHGLEVRFRGSLQGLQLIVSDLEDRKLLLDGFVASGALLFEGTALQRRTA